MTKSYNLERSPESSEMGRMASIALSKLVDRLQQHYGAPPPPPSTDPLELIIWENIAYLANDKRRSEAFAVLKRTIGTRPDEILAAQHSALAAIGKAGILPDLSAEKLLTIAEIAYEVFDSDLRSVLKKPLPQAKRALKRFPSIGDPGAEKILLLTRSYPVMALDSNGLRVLCRVARRGAEELLSDILFGSGCDIWATPQRLRFADPGTPVAPAARSRTVQAVKGALHRMSGQR
jgi:endonuclease III